MHGVGADFVDLHEAMDWVSNYTITQTGFVTFMLAAGKWTYADAVEINHANANRIAIQGSALLGGAPTGSNMSVTGFHNGTDGSNQIIYLRSIYATELSFLGTSGIVILRGGLTIRFLLISGTQSVLPPPSLSRPTYGWGSGIEAYERVSVDCVSVWGMGNSGWFINGGQVMSDSSLNNVVAFNGKHGIWALNGSVVLNAAQMIMVSNQVCGLYVLGGYYQLSGSLGIPGSGGAYCRGNNAGPGLAGIAVLQGAFVMVGNSSIMSSNRGNGVICQGPSMFVGQSSSYLSNTASGLYAYGTATCFVNSSVFASNGAAVTAVGNAYVEITGSSNGDGASPAVGVEGNSGAYIV